ncbi:peripheral myelin protein 22-like [Ruditapes philippinarum]|uniref:peripheral myelin protein 22-like n=1 Tax=Ruditapes philippinarum TaxID=129788 RepID=UPI00295A7A92|nr:peripheral myelin protein 22-like [Ruditapes philippinarum]
MLKSFAKLSLFFVTVATVLTIVGLSTPKWLSRNGHYQGIWEYCYYLTHADGAVKCLKLDILADFETWMNAIRALVIMSVVAEAFCIVLLIFYIKREDGHANLTRIRAAIILCVLAGALCLSAVVLYAVQKNNGQFIKGYNFAWSFILTTIGGGVISLVPIPLLVEIRKSRVLGAYESI